MPEAWSGAVGAAEASRAAADRRRRLFSRMARPQSAPSARPAAAAPAASTPVLPAEHGYAGYTGGVVSSIAGGALRAAGAAPGGGKSVRIEERGEVAGGPAPARRAASAQCPAVRAQVEARRRIAERERRLRAAGGGGAPERPWCNPRCGMVSIRGSWQ